MNVEFTKKFEKQVDKIKDKKLREEISFAVKTVLFAKDITAIPNIKKLRGYKYAFWIRTGNYRIGILFYGNIIYFAAFDHRKNIYKHFP